MRNQKPVYAVRRKERGDFPQSIPSMARRKRSSCFGITLAIVIMAAILVVLLIANGVIPLPSGQKSTVTQTPDAATRQTNQTEQTTTWTATPTNKPSPTPTPKPSSTLTPTPTVTKTSTSTPTEKPLPYIMRGTPEAFPNTLLHPQYDCEEYLFIGGQVWDLQEAAVRGLTIRLGGTYGGDIVDFTSESGSVTLYGESGFEFVLSNKQIEEEDIFIQLEDELGEPLSSRTYLSISGSCLENLVIVNFKQVR
ncbi:MAG: hypothetical protein WA110_06185 [Anaerolineaceae bacterium]